MLDNADTFYLVSGGQAGGGTRERNVYDTRGTDVLSVLRVNCAPCELTREASGTSASVEPRGRARAFKDLRVRVFIVQPARRLERSSGYYRCSRAAACDFDGGVANAARVLTGTG